MQAAKQAIRIGWAGTDITPDWPVNLQGQFYVRLATRARDRLTATALALESADGAAGFITISVDAPKILPIVRETMAAGLARLLPGFDPDRVEIHATHTHTAPQQSAEGWYPELPAAYRPPEDYGRFLGGRLAEIAAGAWQARQPGALAWAYGHAAVGYCRRPAYTNGQSQMYGPANDPTFSHIEGGNDDSVDMLFTFDAAGRLTGLVLNVACPSQCTEHLSEMSADYWHDVREELRRRHGAGLFVLPQCSAAGDQAPHLILHKAAEDRMLRLRGLLTDGLTFDLAQRAAIAKRLSDTVDEALPAARRDLRAEVELAYEKVTLAVPQRLLTPAEVAEARRVVEECKMAALKLEGEDPLSKARSANHARQRYFEWTLERLAAQRAGRTTMDVDLHAARIGDIAMATNRFEYYLDFGQRIKARAKAIQTFVVQLSGPGTYLPTARAVQGGSYGAWFASALVSSDGGARIAEESIRLVNQWF